MTRNRMIQLGALVTLVLTLVAGGSLMPSLTALSRDHYLRYTDEPVEGAPPIVAIGQSIGALRGLIVDALWIKVNIMKDKGLFYEMFADTELITKLQPRFAQVWAFHGHNMAYNISVTMNSREERWKWVKSGIELVRNQGLRYNPNDLQLHRELAFWFKHKLEGYADDAHLYYKREFRREWHLLLGQPPYEWEDRIAWIKEVADAPETLDEAERRTPGVKTLVEQLRSELSPVRQRFETFLDRDFLQMFGWWQSFKQDSQAARILGSEQEMRLAFPWYDALNKLASDPELQEQWDALIAHVRKRVLLDEYNMDPQLMYEYTRDVGPLDWRHGESHALYWARKGSQAGEKRIIRDDDYFRIVNNDRIQLQAMQALARSGRITLDPFDELSDQVPSQFPDPRWIEILDGQFEVFVAKHERLKKPGMRGDLFVDFFENFMSAAVREYYRSGYPEQAQKILDKLDRIFGRGGTPPDPITYARDLQTFVREQTAGEYNFQPELSRSDVSAALNHGIRVGLGENRPEVYRNAKKFADWVIGWFKNNEDFDYTNKFGEGRMRSLIADLEGSLPPAFFLVMIDPTVPLATRLAIWNNVDRYDPQVKLDMECDYGQQFRQQMVWQLERSVLGRNATVDQLFPKPPGIEAYCQARRQQQQQQQQRQRPDEAPVQIAPGVPN